MFALYPVPTFCLNAISGIKWGQSAMAHPELIKARIRERGTTCAELAEAHGYHRGAVSRALHHPWPHVEAFIARFLGETPQDLFPERYAADGSPRIATRRSRKTHPNTPAGRGNVSEPAND